MDAEHSRVGLAFMTVSVLGMGNISILPYNIIVILTAHDNRIVVVLQLLSYHFCIIIGTFIPN